MSRSKKILTDEEFLSNIETLSSDEDDDFVIIGAEMG